jgi:hypothetical protein
MELISFIRENAETDNLLGNLSRVILEDSDFPIEKSSKEMFEYLDFKMINAQNSQVYLEFKRAFLKTK